MIAVSIRKRFLFLMQIDFPGSDFCGHLVGHRFEIAFLKNHDSKRESFPVIPEYGRHVESKQSIRSNIIKTIPFLI